MGSDLQQLDYEGDGGESLYSQLAYLFFAVSLMCICQRLNLQDLWNKKQDLWNNRADSKMDSNRTVADAALNQATHATGEATRAVQTAVGAQGAAQAAQDTANAARNQAGLAQASATAAQARADAAHAQADDATAQAGLARDEAGAAKRAVNRLRAEVRVLKRRIMHTELAAATWRATWDKINVRVRNHLYDELDVRRHYEKQTVSDLLESTVDNDLRDLYKLLAPVKDRTVLEEERSRAERCVRICSCLGLPVPTDLQDRYKIQE
ncbi:unnamed protein product [Amoebophrya sp. A120]|nr:unnamed protein product [Amoebophrya sp. A120]|eukprot:GSA120T00002723001.1